MNLVVGQRLWILVTAVVAAASFAGVPAVAEDPNQYNCDPTGRVLCTGIAVGANVPCDAVLAPVVNCDFTWGWIAQSFSRAFLPGEMSAEGTYRVDVCSSVSGCFLLEEGDFGGACSWVGAANVCTLDGGGDGSYRGDALVMGECVTITVSVQGSAAGQVPPGGLPPVASETFDHVSDGAGQVCLVDDGR